MKVVVVGAGNVGRALAGALAAEGRDVVVVERNPAVADRIESELDVSVVRGNGSRPAVLEKCGVKKGGDVDALIACTKYDDTNLMSCWLARHSGVPRVLARVRNSEFTDTPDWGADLGIDVMASPERVLAREIASLLTINSAVHSSELFNGRAGSFAFRVEEDSPICGLSLREVGAKYPDFGAVIVYVERGESGFVPAGDWTAMVGDLCFVITLNERVKKVQKLFDADRHKNLSRVIIVGGGKLGINLAQRLRANARRVEVILVEKDYERCLALANDLSDVQVIHGDGMDVDLMTQIGVEGADGVVAMTENDELNVIIASLANRNDNVKTIAVVRNEVYDELEGRLPVDVMVNPNKTLASTFLRHIRYPNSAGMLTLIDRIGAEVMEIRLSEGNAAVGRRLMDLHLPKGILVALIVRNGKYLVPGGADVLREGDILSVFAMADLMPHAMEFFGAAKS